jgi:alkylation response protein AidB-like acyl-CoA dehydrogenase
MDFSLTTEQQAFRDDLRAWLRDNLTDEFRTRRGRVADSEWVAVRLRWQRRVYEGGYAGISWPKAYGGRGASLIEEMIFNQEIVGARAPEMVNGIGLYMAGPTIIAHGTDAQKTRYLAPLLSGDEIWCQGFSEPNSGSDLASLRTRAVRDGDDYVVNGQKVWTTLGHVARFCILLTRTGSQESRHGGLTYLIVDMKSPGVEVRPLRQITGDAEFNEIYFTDVRVPAANLLGEEGAGWKVAMTTLMHERASLGVGLQVRTRIALEDLMTLARAAHPARGEAGDRGGSAAVRPVGVPPSGLDPILRQEIAQLAIDIEAMRLNSYRGLTRMLRGEQPGPEGSINKLMWSEVNQRLCDTALEVLGAQSLLGEGEELAEAEGRWSYGMLRSRANSIEGGTSEVLRNILAERVLGLPRGR